MSDMGQGLVDAASDAFDVGHFNFDAVVVAVLRKLAGRPGMIDGAGEWISVSYLSRLADSIEKGGE